MKYSLLSDEELVQKAKNGDRLCQDIIIKKYKFLAKKIARSYFLVGADSSDLVQEAMIGIWDAIMDYDSSSKNSFFNFASLCANREVYSAIRKYSGKKQEPLNNGLSLSPLVFGEEGEDIIFYLPSNELSPEDAIIEKEQLKELKNYIKTKTSKFERKVLELYLKGYSYNEITEKLDTNSKSVDNALTRIKSKLENLKK